MANGEWINDDGLWLHKHFDKTHSKNLFLYFEYFIRHFWPPSQFDSREILCSKGNIVGCLQNENEKKKKRNKFEWRRMILISALNLVENPCEMSAINGILFAIVMSSSPWNKQAQLIKWKIQYGNTSSICFCAKLAITIDSDIECHRNSARLLCIWD